MDDPPPHTLVYIQTHVFKHTAKQMHFKMGEAVTLLASCHRLHQSHIS